MNAPTRHDTVVGDLRQAIITGVIPPGSRLLQVELADRLGVSRIPLREALRTLHAEGLVLIEPNRGAVCRPLDPKDVSDLYAVRVVLEQLAARSSAALFADLRDATEAKRQLALAAAARSDVVGLIRLDFEFHEGLASASGNPHLSRCLDGCWSQIERAMHYFLSHSAAVDVIWGEHASIARAIAYGDGPGAEDLLERHIVESRNVILRGLGRADQ